MIGGDSPILTLNISVNNYCKFVWCMETDLSSFRIVIHQQMNFYSDKLTLRLLHVDCLSGYLILLCGTSTLKVNNWTEKLQKL